MAYDPYDEDLRSVLESIAGPQTAIPTAPKQNQGLMDDLGTDIKRGAQQIPGAITGLLDIPVAAVTGKPLVSQGWEEIGKLTGIQPGQWAKEAEAEYSPERQQANREIQQVWDDPNAGFLETAGAYAAHPGKTLGLVAESLPMTAAGGALGRIAYTRGAGAAVPRGAAGPTIPGYLERQFGDKAGRIAGAIGEGAIGAGASMDALTEAGVDGRTAALASLGSGVGTGALGYAGAGMAKKLGLEDIETEMATLGRGVDGPQTWGGVGKNIVKGGLAEGLLEEFPQSVQEQGWSNLAQGKDLDEGMLRAGVEGALAGSAMGAAANVRFPARVEPPPVAGADPTIDVVNGAPSAPAGAAPQQLEMFPDINLPVVPPSNGQTADGKQMFVQPNGDTLTTPEVDVVEKRPSPEEIAAFEAEEVRNRMGDLFSGTESAPPMPTRERKLREQDADDIIKHAEESGMKGTSLQAQKDLAERVRSGEISAEQVHSNRINRHYRNLRGAKYDMEGHDAGIDAITGANTETVNVTDQGGWHYRLPTNSKVKSGGKTKDRISMNVRSSPELIAALDKFIDGKMVYYKTPDESGRWTERHDPVTVYFKEDVTPEMEAELSALAEKYGREGPQLPGRAIGKNAAAQTTPTQQDIDTLLARADAVGAGAAARSYFKGSNVSSGQLMAVDRLVSELEGYDAAEQQPAAAPVGDLESDDASGMSVTTAPEGRKSELPDKIARGISNALLADAKNQDITRGVPTVPDAGGQKATRLASSIAELFRSLVALDKQSRKLPRMTGRTGGKTDSAVTNAIATVKKRIESARTSVNGKAALSLEKAGSNVVRMALNKVGMQKGATSATLAQYEAALAELETLVATENGVTGDIKLPGGAAYAIERGMEAAGARAGREQAQAQAAVDAAIADVYKAVKSLPGHDTKAKQDQTIAKISGLIKTAVQTEIADANAAAAEAAEMLSESDWEDLMEGNASYAMRQSFAELNAPSIISTMAKRLDVLTSSYLASARDGHSGQIVRGRDTRTSTEVGNNKRVERGFAEALDHLSKHGRPLERTLASLVSRVLAATGATVEVAYYKPGELDVKDENGNVITVHGDSTPIPGGYQIRLTNTSPELFLHEALHTATSAWIAQHRTHGAVKRLAYAYNRLNKLVDPKNELAAGNLKAAGLSVKQANAIQQILKGINDKVAAQKSKASADYITASEIISYSMTNADFAKLLKWIDAEADIKEQGEALSEERAALRDKIGNALKGLYQAIRGFIMAALGTQQKRLYDYVLDNTLFVLEGAQTEGKALKVGNQQTLESASTSALSDGAEFKLDDDSRVWLEKKSWGWQALSGKDGKVVKNFRSDEQAQKWLRDNGATAVDMESTLQAASATISTGAALDQAVAKIVSPVTKRTKAAKDKANTFLDNMIRAFPGLGKFLAGLVDNIDVTSNFGKHVADMLQRYSAQRAGASVLGNVIEDALKGLNGDDAAKVFHALRDPANIASLPDTLQPLVVQTRREMQKLIDEAEKRGLLDKSLQGATVTDVIRYVTDNKADIATSGFSVSKIKRAIAARDLSSRKMFDPVHGDIDFQGADVKDVESLLQLRYYTDTTVGDSFTAVPMGQKVPAGKTEWRMYRAGKDSAVFIRTKSLDEIAKEVGGIDGQDLANYLANTVAALSKAVAADQLITSMMGENFDEKGKNKDNQFIYDPKDELPADVKANMIRPDWVGWDGSNLPAATREEARRSDRWVTLKGSAWGKLDGMVINGSVLASLYDMHSTERIPFRTVSESMRMWKVGKTALSIPTHVTNVMSSFILAYFHDIPFSQIKKAAGIVLRATFPERAKQLGFPPLTAAERQMWEAFQTSGAMLGNFSANELHGRIAESLARKVDAGRVKRQGSAQQLVDGLLQHENVKAGWEKSKQMANWVGDKVDVAKTVYEAEDNIFRLAAFMSELDRKPGNHEAAGAFAKYAMIDYSINARYINAARQTVLPFVAWPYRAAPMLMKIAIEKPHKLPVVMSAIAAIGTIGFMAGGGDDDETYKKLPDYMRQRIFGFGPRAYVRMPWGDAENPVFMNIGKWIPGADLASSDDFMGLPFWPSAATPGGPFIAAIMAGFGYDSFMGRKIWADTNTPSENAKESFKQLASQVSPGVLTESVKLADKLMDPKKGLIGNDINNAYAISRFLGARMYEQNMTEAAVRQFKEVEYMERQFKIEINRKAREYARKENPDWEAYAEWRSDKLQTMADKIAEIKGED